ncbi:transposase domain-containing protein [Blautia obeum]
MNPFRYLEHVLTVLKGHQDDREYSFIDDILPWSEKLPAICRSKTKATNI